MNNISKKLLGCTIALTTVFAQTAIPVMAIEPGVAQITQDQIEASYQKAIQEVIIPRYEADGSKTEQHVSSYLMKHLDNSNLTAKKDTTNKLLEVDLQLKDVYLDSQYLNGVSPAGMGYYKMLNYYTSVKQVKQLLDANPDYQVKDNKGNILSVGYIDELLGLLDQINDIDPTTNLKYDARSAFDTDYFKNNKNVGGTDVIATSKEGNVSLEFHIDSHGWWGYDLGAHDSITGLVMGMEDKEAYDAQHDMTTQYGNFFVIEMANDAYGTWYMLRNTDLENPMIYVSKDKKEAFMIDVDFYGQNVLNQVIKSVIGPQCESLKIFLTHNHPDHVNNLDIIAKDDYLRGITTIVWPENEPHTKLNGTDLISGINWKGIQTVKDMEKFTAAGCEFQFVEISEEHTPGGGQLADLSHKVIYSGDTLGAQVHLGGGSATYSKVDAWYKGATKAAQYIKENNIKYNIGGHTSYLNTSDFAQWIANIMGYVKDQFETNPDYTGGLIIAENGKIVDGQRMGEMFKNGLTDREELAVASMNVRDDRTNLNATNDDGTLKNKIEVSDIPDQKYTGKAITPEVKVTVNDKELALDTDYKVTYENNIEPGTATLTITGTGMYKGTVTKEFKIVKEDVKDPTITEDKNDKNNTSGNKTDTSPKKDEAKKDQVKTGDTTTLIAFVSMALVSLCSVLFLKKKKFSK